MFEIKYVNIFDSYIIVDEQRECLHSDGSIFRTGEYFPSYVVAQKILDKYYPKPEHEWKHGDVFLTGRERKSSDYAMIYFNTFHGIKLFCIGTGSMSCGADHSPSISSWLAGATFLFNVKNIIKEKLCPHQK